MNLLKSEKKENVRSFNYVPAILIDVCIPVYLLYLYIISI